MSQPIQPQQPFGQHPQPMPAPPVQQPPKRKRFGWLAIILTAVISLGVGGAVGGTGGGGGSTTKASPAPTVTRTITETPGVNTAPTQEPTTQAPTTAPAKWSPKPKDFRVNIKVTDKQCFGSAGCNVTYKISLDLLGSQEIPSEGTTDITYKISGAEQEIIGTITLNSQGKFSAGEESTSTGSSSARLVAKVTEVAYNEFG